MLSILYIVFSGVWVALQRARIHTWKWTITAYDWSDHHWQCSHACQQDGAPNYTVTRRASRRTGCTRTVLGSLKRISDPQTLHVWTYWIIASSGPCWKSTIDSSRNPRQLMSWKSLCKPCGKICHKHTSRWRWWTSPSAWLPAWLLMVVTSIICSKGPFPSLYLHLSVKTPARFRAPTS